MFRYNFFVKKSKKISEFSPGDTVINNRTGQKTICRYKNRNTSSI